MRGVFELLINNDAENMSGRNKKTGELGIPVISEDESPAGF